MYIVFSTYIHAYGFLQLKYRTLLFTPLIVPYQVLPFWGLAIKGFSVFPKPTTLHEPHYQEDWLWSLILLQSYSRSILQPKPTGMVSSRIWTLVTVSIPYDDNHNTMNANKDMKIHQFKSMYSTLIDYSDRLFTLIIPCRIQRCCNFIFGFRFPTSQILLSISILIGYNSVRNHKILLSLV